MVQLSLIIKDGETTFHQNILVEKHNLNKFNGVVSELAKKLEKQYKESEHGN